MLQCGCLLFLSFLFRSIVINTFEEVVLIIILALWIWLGFLHVYKWNTYPLSRLKSFWILNFWILSHSILAFLSVFCFFLEGFDVSLYICDRVIETYTFFDYFLISSHEYTRIFNAWGVLDFKRWDIISRTFFLNWLNLLVFYLPLLTSFFLYWHTHPFLVSLWSLWSVRLRCLPILLFFSLMRIDAGIFIYDFRYFLGERGCFKTSTVSSERLTT